MSRSGAALFVALVVVLLGGMVAVLATMLAISEVKSGAAWRDQQVAVSLATSAVARSREWAESLFDSLLAGESAELTDTLTLTRLGDSLAILTATTGYRAGEEVTTLLLLAGRDSLGNRRLAASGSRSRFHPIR
jgi:hypothetical protein